MTWPIVSLGEVSKVVSGATPRTGERRFWDGDVLWTTPKDVSDLDTPYLDRPPRTITNEGLRSCAASLLPPNSVLLSSRAPIGLVAINRLPVATNQGFKSLVPEQDKLDSKFLYHWLKSKTGYLQSLGNGATFKEVSKATVERIEIPLPPLPEQRRIAAILDKADALRRKRKRAIELLDSLTQSIFLEMFALSLNTEKRTIGELCTPIQTWTPTRFPDAPPFRYIDIGSVDQGTKEIVKAATVQPTNAPSRARQKVFAGDILVSTVRPNLNAVAIVPPDLHGATASTGFCVLRPRTPAATAEFLYTIVRSHQFVKSMVEQATGASYPAVTDKIVKSFMVPVIDREQLDQLSQTAKLQRMQLTSMKEGQAHADYLFSSLQHRAFSGQL